MIRILIVNNDKILIDTLCLSLKEKEYDISIAHTGGEALTLIEQSSFTLIILDLILPDMEGINVLVQIRQKHSANDLPVIILDDTTNEQNITQALDIGANDFIYKPLKKNIIALKIKKTLTLHENNQKLINIIEEKEVLIEQQNDFFDFLPLAALITDQNGVIEKLNLIAYDLFGIETGCDIYHLCGEILNCNKTTDGTCGTMQTCRDCIIRNTLEESFTTNANILQREGTFCLSTDNQVTELNLVVSSTLINSQDGKKALITIDDITRQKNAEKSLLDSTQIFKALFDSAIDGMLLADVETHNLLMANDAICTMLGYNPGELTGLTALDLHPKKDLPQVMKVFKKQAEGKLKVSENMPVKRKDGSVFIADISSSPISINDKHYLLGIFRDITNRKKTMQALEESEAKLKEAQKIALLGNWELDIVNNNLYWSDEIYEIFGMNPRDFQATYEAFLETVHPDDRELVNEAYTSSLKTQVPYEIVHRLKLKNGELKYVREQCNTKFDETGNPLKSVGIVQDVTLQVTAADDLEKANNELKKALDEKEVLLKEIHHRVKNNLQTIKSLLFKQQRICKDKQTKTVLQESMDRVTSMALIHEQIYRSKDIKNINFAKYIRDFSHTLMHTYRQPDTYITLTLNTEDVLLPLDNAIPCALIVNELISNALKYAFPDKKEGNIIVDLAIEHKNTIKLSVTDDGIGLPPDFDPVQTDSLGMFIINNIATRQLGGTLTITPQPGTKMEITFPYTNKE